MTDEREVSEIDESDERSAGRKAPRANPAPPTEAIILKSSD